MLSNPGSHATLRSDLSGLLALATKAPLPAAANAIVAFHDMLDGCLRAAPGANQTREVVSTMLALAPDFGQALQRRDLLSQRDPPGQPGSDIGEGQWGGSMTRVEQAAAATTVLMVQHAAGSPKEAVRKLLNDLRGQAHLCLRLAVSQPADASPQKVGPIIHSAARLAEAAVKVGDITKAAQAPLAQLAQRCRVGVDADVARGRQSRPAGSDLPGGGSWQSVWAAPLGAVVEVLAQLAVGAQEVPPTTASEVLSGVAALLAHEAAPLSSCGWSAPDVANGILAPLNPAWVDAPRGDPARKVYKQIGRAMLLKVGEATQMTCQRLPEAASTQAPSPAAAYAAARLSDLVCHSTNPGLPLLGASILRQPSLVRAFSGSITAALQRVSKLLQRREFEVGPPAQSSVFIAGYQLASAAAIVLRLAVAAGVDALEHDSMHAVMRAVAGHCHCPHGVLHNFLRTASIEAHLVESERLVIDSFRLDASTIGEAADAILTAAEAQPPHTASPALISAVCAAVPAYFGLAQMQSTYLMVRSPPDAASRPDLSAIQRGAQLVDKMLRTFGPAAEGCLGGACAQTLLFAIETAVNPRLAPHTLPPIRAACSTLEALLRRGNNWASWDPAQPDVWQYIPGGWANMTHFLPQVVQAPTLAQEQEFDALLDRVTDAMELREGKLEADGGSHA